MGLFGTKGICDVCGKENRVFELKDGVICKECTRTCDPYYVLNASFKNTTLDEFKKEVDKASQNKQKFDKFECKKVIANTLEMNNETRQWKIKRSPKIYTRVFSFTDIVDFELLENGQTTITKKGIGKALAGGMLLGATGAIVGGMTAKGVSTGIINLLQIRITVNDQSNPNEYITLINTPTKVGSFIYNAQYAAAQQILSELALMTKSMNEEVSEKPLEISLADEIKKLKEMLNEGIITPQEFESAKAKILE